MTNTTNGKESVPKDSPEEIISAIDVVEDNDDGYVTAPFSVMATRRLQIASLMPGDWRFVHSRSVIIDNESSRLSIDTDDHVATTNIKDRSDLAKLPALMRVMRAIGQEAVTGFIVDYRRVTDPFYDDLGLSEGPGSAIYMQRQGDYGAELPLGTLFSDNDQTRYVGDKHFRGSALYLAQEVDRFVQKLKSSDK